MVFGRERVAHVFYPEATDERCTAALMLEIDPVGLVRGLSRGGPASGSELARQEQISPQSMGATIAELDGSAKP